MQRMQLLNHEELTRRETHRMVERRDIDERDIDRLLAALTDVQIAAVFGMTEIEVFQLRQSRQKLPPRQSQRPNPTGKRNS